MNPENEVPSEPVERFALDSMNGTVDEDPDGEFVKYEALSALRASWEKDIDKLRSDHTEYEKIINSEYAKVKALEAEKKGLEDRVRDGDQLCKDKHEVILKLQERVKDLLKGEAESMEEISQLKAKVAELEAELQATRKACDQAHQNTLDRDEEIDRLKAENETLGSENAGFEGLVKALEEKIDRLTSALGVAMEIIRKILKQCPRVAVDHACIECTPAGSSVVEGFLCGFHEGVKALSDPSGSVAFEKWKKMEAVVEAARYLVKELEAPHQSIAHLVDTDDNAGQYLREALEAYESRGHA